MLPQELGAALLAVEDDQRFVDYGSGGSQSVDEAELGPAVGHEVLDQQACVLGPRVAAFEKEVAAYCSVSHAVGCASGTDAILIGLRALGVGNGEEVITTPYSFFATAGAIVNAKGRPVFVDIERDSFNIDPGQVWAAVTPNTRVIEPVHLFGQCADLDPLIEIARDRDAVVIEDAAQALGARYRVAAGDELHAGTVGDVGCYSFFPTKNLGGFGDGGMMVTSDDDIAERLRLLRVHGGRQMYHHRFVGWNSRLDALQAAVLPPRTSMRRRSPSGSGPRHPKRLAEMRAGPSTPSASGGGSTTREEFGT